MSSNHNLEMFRQVEEMIGRLERLEAGNAVLKKENTELKAELDRVSRIADRALDQVDELNEVVDAQKARIDHLTEENTLLKNDNKRLKSQINNDSNNSSNPPSTDQKGKRANKYNSRQKTGKKSGGQPGHKGKTLTKAYVQDRIKDGSFKHELVEHGQVSEDYKVRYVIDLPSEPIAVEHRFYADAVGDYHIPSEYNSDVIYGDNIAAFIIDLHVTANASSNHIVELLKDTWDITISEGTVDNILTRSAERAEAALNKIENEQLNADVLFTDATTTSVNGKQTYIRNTSTADDVLYHYMSSKSIASIKKNTPLKHFAGTLVHDHETALYHFGTEHAECNVHVLRYLKKCTEEARNPWSKDMAKLFSDINTERNACIQDGISAFPEDKIRSVSDRYSEILCQGYEQNKKTKYQYAKKDELALLNRLSKNKQNHLMFVSDFNIPFDNNASERDLRKVKSHTKMSGGFRTEAGIKRYCNLMSVIQTARKRHLNVLYTLTSILRGEPAF